MTDAESIETTGEDALETLRLSAPERVAVERTTVDGFPDALERVVERPALGTPLPFAGVSLADADVPRLPTDGPGERAGEAGHGPDPDGDSDGDRDRVGGRERERERGRLLEGATTGVTPAGLAVAERGTVSVRSRAAGDELVSLYPGRHVAVLRASDVVPDVRTAVERTARDVEAARARRRGEAGGGGDAGGHGRTVATDSEVLTTGPSATADMGALVEGVHGPREVVVLALEDR